MPENQLEQAYRMVREVFLGDFTELSISKYLAGVDSTSQFNTETGAAPIVLIDLTNTSDEEAMELLQHQLRLCADNVNLRLRNARFDENIWVAERLSGLVGTIDLMWKHGSLFTHCEHKEDGSRKQGQLITGTEHVHYYEDVIRNRVEKCAEKGIVPTLEVIRFDGMGEGSEQYVRSLKKQGQKLGINIIDANWADATTEGLSNAIARLSNECPHVNGIMILKPIPETIILDAVARNLDYRKDVDGLNYDSGSASLFRPCTAEAVADILMLNGIDPSRKDIVVLGRSRSVGLPIAKLMLDHYDATVTVCHSKTIGVKAKCRLADIVISATNKPDLIDGAYVSQNAVVVDVGVHPMEDGTIHGDVNLSSVSPLVKAVTPVRGGVGALTSVILLDHVARATCFQNHILMN